MDQIKYCPECGEECERDQVDIGVGMLYGPWGCWKCKWSEKVEYCSYGAVDGICPAAEETGYYVDPLGGLDPTKKITKDFPQKED